MIHPQVAEATPRRGLTGDRLHTFVREVIQRCEGKEDDYSVAAISQLLSCAFTGVALDATASDPAAADLIRDLAASRTFNELADVDRDDWVKPCSMDELILRARELVDTLGLRQERQP